MNQACDIFSESEFCGTRGNSEGNLGSGISDLRFPGAGKDLGEIWERSGRVLGELWESSGRDLGEIWERSGRALGELWESSGEALGEIWKSSGRALGDSGGSAINVHCENLMFLQKFL